MSIVGPAGAAPGGGVIDDTIVIIDDSIPAPEPEEPVSVFGDSGSGQFLLSLRRRRRSNIYPVSR